MAVYDPAPSLTFGYQNSFPVPHHSAAHHHSQATNQQINMTLHWFSSAEPKAEITITATASSSSFMPLGFGYSPLFPPQRFSLKVVHIDTHRRFYVCGYMKRWKNVSFFSFSLLLIEKKKNFFFLCCFLIPPTHIFK